MGMQRQVWSVNALAIEFNTDRRTLSKWLQDLPPAESRKIGDRIEKRWFLSDVVNHLQRDKRAIQRGADDREAEIRRGLNAWIADTLVHALLDSRYFQALLLKGPDEEDISPEAGEHALSTAVLAITYGLADVMGEPDIQFNLPDSIIEIMRRSGDRRKAQQAVRCSST
jgi:hypothetical protein